MKTEELFDSQLDEIKLKHAIGAAVVGAALSLSGNHSGKAPDPVTRSITKQQSSTKDVNSDELAQIVMKHYNVNKEQAKKIVDTVKKHAKPTFPKVIDLLAIIGIESGFNPNAKSNLKHDPAIGLTQIRPKMWGLDASSLKSNIEQQIKKSVEILAHNYERLGNKDDAVHAYNIGISNVIHDKKPNLKYVQKWKEELKKYDI